MMQRVLLHIGAPKCGSTYLQRVLLKNQTHLRQAGINYPHRGHGHPGNGARIHHITYDWLKDNLDGFHTLILSHETLFSLASKGRKLANLCIAQGVMLQIIAFLRPFADIIYGDYSQNIKQNFDHFARQKCAFGGRSFRQFVLSREKQIAADEFLRDWQGLSQHPLILRRHHDIQDTMETVLDTNIKLDWRIPKFRANPSIPMQTCEIITDLINASDVDAARMHLQNPSGENLSNTARRDWITGVFARRAKNLNRQFGIVLK